MSEWEGEGRGHGDHLPKSHNEGEDYTPRTPREKVIVYELLSDLDRYTDRTNSYIFGILPVTDVIPKEAIKRWIDCQHKKLAEGDE